MRTSGLFQKLRKNLLKFWMMMALNVMILNILESWIKDSLTSLVHSDMYDLEGC